MTDDLEAVASTWVEREIAALEADVRHYIVDLEEAFGVRDWAGVARIYREIAGLADRLEELDPRSRTKVLDRLERREAARLEESVSETDELDELAMRGSDALAASDYLADAEDDGATGA